MYASSRQPKNQHFSSTEPKPEILLFALCILGGIRAYFLRKVADLHGFSNLVVTETHYFTDTVTATRFLATKVETSTKIVQVTASITGDGAREEEKDEKEGSKIEFRPIETSNGMNVGGASDALSSSSEHSETTMISPRQPQGPQPNALNSSSSTESPYIDAITPSSPAKYRQLSENTPLRPQPFHKPRQPEPSSTTTQTQPPNTTATSPTTARRPPYPRVTQFLNKPHHCDEPKTPSTTQTKSQKDSLENCKHVIVTASIVTAAFVICLFVLSFLVAIHLNANTKALNKFNEQSLEAGNGFGVIAEEDVRGVETVTEVQMVTSTERHTVMDRVEKTVTKVHTVTVTEKEKHAVTMTGSGIVSTATELVIFVSDT
ncbi:hypothetical protein D6D19_03116 [Aureobasidium pullulans]|uniref:Uncharacterized protein n=1 Tax=Aureobasidium pullulans TaxID=5580 RepID=A0A4S9AAZ4_AURPU|nr:hypothetical protein D6D19_03116 [Aureobasidium pullulans]